MRWLVVAVALCFGVATASNGTERPPHPPKASLWEERPPLKPWSDEGTCANHGHGGEWSVLLDQGIVLVREYQYTETIGDLPFSRDHIAQALGPQIRLADVHFIPVADGFLLGVDAGEFGGGIWWFSPKGESHYRVLKANVKGFARVPEGIVAVDGLAHLTLRHGAVHGLEPDGTTGRWIVRRSVDLGTAAELFVTTPDDALLIVTSDGLVRYRDGETEQLIRSDYSQLYPNSIVRTADGHIFVGMRYAIVEFRSRGATFRERWLVPPACPSLVRPWGGECECR